MKGCGMLGLLRFLHTAETAKLDSIPITGSARVRLSFWLTLFRAMRSRRCICLRMDGCQNHGLVLGL